MVILFLDRKVQSWNDGHPLYIYYKFSSILSKKSIRSCSEEQQADSNINQEEEMHRKSQGKFEKEKQRRKTCLTRKQISL